MTEETKNINKEKTQTFCLCFDEINKLYEETQKHIKRDDYGFAPVMLIRIEHDAEWDEKEYISTICMHELTTATMQYKKDGEKINLPWIDITDENKFDFI